MDLQGKLIGELKAEAVTVNIQQNITQVSVELLNVLRDKFPEAYDYLQGQVFDKYTVG